MQGSPGPSARAAPPARFMYMQCAPINAGVQASACGRRSGTASALARSHESAGMVVSAEHGSKQKLFAIRVSISVRHNKQVT